MSFLKRLFRRPQPPPAPRIVIITLNNKEGTILAALNSLEFHPNAYEFGTAAILDGKGRPTAPITRVRIDENEIASIRIVRA